VIGGIHRQLQTCLYGMKNRGNRTLSTRYILLLPRTSVAAVKSPIVDGGKLFHRGHDDGVPDDNGSVGKDDEF
jgi:hypothetical protein